jgi:SAM-dependent methyltransferase
LSGYVSEIEYTHGYYFELSPLRALQALRLAGFSRPGGTGRRYLELGYGQGLAANIHAAATGLEIWGTDFFPSHAAGARELANEAETGATLFDLSFAELLDRRDLPQFDMIALHGIWSWIDDGARRTIVEIARRHLAPGGVFYVSYNDLAGWAPFLPLRHLLKLYVDSGAARDAIADRIGAALDFAQKVADAGAAYFRVNPVAVERLKQIQGQARNYLAHEYFNAVWEPVPFSEMSERLDGANLTFAARAAFLDDLDAVHIAPEGNALLAGIANPVLRESIRDFFVGQQFRRDYFVRGPRRSAFLHQLKALREMRVVLARLPAEIQLKFTGARGEAQLDAAIYTPVIEILAGDGMRAKTVGELEATLAPRGMTFLRVIEAVKILLGKADLFFVQDDAVAAAAVPKTRRLNRCLMERAGVSGDVAFLASPVTGGGVSVMRFEQLFLQAREDGLATPAEWAGHAWRILASQGQRLLKDGAAIESEADNVAELTQQAEVFATQRLPVLVNLGIG